MLVPDNDERALAEKMTALLKNPLLRRRMALGALRDVKQFTWEKAADLTCQLYEKVLSER